MSFIYLKLSFKFLTSFKLKFFAFRFAFKSSSKSKTYVSKVEVKDIGLHEVFSIILKKICDERIFISFILNIESQYKYIYC